MRNSVLSILKSLYKLFFWGVGGRRKPRVREAFQATEMQVWLWSTSSGAERKEMSRRGGLWGEDKSF